MATKQQGVKDIARKLNETQGKPLDISKTKTPLNKSGVTLPPVKKK